MAERVVDNRYLQLITLEVVYGEADAVNGDRAMKNKCVRKAIRKADVDQQCVVGLGDVLDMRDAVYVTLDDVAAESRAGPHRALEVDLCAGAPIRDSRSAGSRYNSGYSEPAVAEFADGEAR